MKFKIRQETITFSKDKRKKDNQYKTELYNKRASMEINLNSADKPEEMQTIQSEINSLNIEIELYEQNKAYGHFIRSKAYFIEHNQRNSNMFFNLEKQNYNEKLIKKLKLDDGKEITKSDEILEETAHFYESRYKRNPLVSDQNYDFFFRNNIPKLSAEQKKRLK